MAKQRRQTAPPAPPPAPTLADRLDAQRLHEIQERIRDGRKLSQGDRAFLKRKEREANDNKRRELLSAVPQYALLEILDTTRKVLRSWEAEGLPRSGPTCYNVFGVVPWLWRHLADRAKRKQKGQDAEAEQRYRHAKAEREELTVRALKGDLIRRSDAASALVAQTIALREAFENLPDEFDAANMTREEREELRKTIRAILDQYASHEF